MLFILIKKQHAKYKIISCSNYKSRKQNSKTIWLNKSNKICFKEEYSMYTQTLYELSQEAERLLQLSDNSCSYWKKYLSLYPETMRHNWLYPGVSLISPNVTRC